MIKNLVLHFNLVNKHRFKVFKLCCRAGIPFRDANLDLDNYEIINNRKFEVENSTLESSSRYLKRCKNEI